MNPTDYYLLILGMGAVTYIPRWLPLFFLSRRQLPQWFVDWLDLIPAAVLSALLLPALLLSGDPKSLAPASPEVIAAIPTLAFALFTRSLGATVVVGMGAYWLVGKLF